MGKITQTTGRDILDDFAPAFAHLNDDVLFGEVWNEPDIMLIKSLIFLEIMIYQGTSKNLTEFLEVSTNMYECILGNTNYVCSRTNKQSIIDTRG